MGLFTKDASDEPTDEPRGKETRIQRDFRRAGKCAKDNLDKATKDPNRLGNRGRGSR